MYSGNVNARKRGIKTHGSEELFLAARYSNERVNEALVSFYELSEEREYSGERLIPRRIKSADIDKQLSNCHFDKEHLASLIKFIDTEWLNVKIREMKR